MKFKPEQIAFDSARMEDMDGHMHVTCNISKACVSPYLGHEIPGYIELNLQPDRVYKMYRDPVELEKAADSFNGKQLLIKHIAVGAKEPQLHLTAGAVHDSFFEAPFLKAKLSVWTQKAKELIQRKVQRELSSSYRYAADMTPGRTPDTGELYDGRMVGILGNHVALVQEGRVGHDVLVADANPFGAHKMAFKKLLAHLAPFLASDADMEKVDKACVKAKADDEMDDDDAIEDKKKNKGKKTNDEANPEVIAAAIKTAVDKATAGMVTQDQMNVAVAAAQKQTKDAQSALHAAQRVTEPVVGVIVGDSADVVYDGALKKLGVETKDIHPSAFPQMFAMAAKQKVKTPPPGGANDSANPVNFDSIFGT